MSTSAVEALHRAATDLLDDYVAGIWWPTPHEQTVIEELWRASTITARHVQVYQQLVDKEYLVKGRLLGALAPAEAVLRDAGLAAGKGHAAVACFQELVTALAEDRQGYRIRPSQQQVTVQGMIRLVWDDGLSRIPLECGQCQARTGGTLTVTDDRATYTCSAGHTTSDHRLDADAVRHAIDSQGSRRRLPGNLDVPGAPADGR
ncbi:hypothetical protein ACSNOH_28590 [Streptomyces sp. URMC 127]|uniref:hypothetical protein n=1 Tax=Streptomyces sp. URMC 127 TaxID=3423402 RepID=UPI003F1D2AD2